jgi:hypothetical protein
MVLHGNLKLFQMLAKGIQLCEVSTSNTTTMKESHQNNQRPIHDGL